MSKVYKFWIILLGVIGGGSLLYSIGIVLSMGWHLSYLYFWMGLFLFCLILEVGLFVTTRTGKTPPRWIVIPVEILVLVFCMIFIVIEAIIIAASKQEPENGANYLIVLGAKVNGNQPSLVLRERIRAAADYLKQNPDTIVIASGGQGLDENISEAQCIYEQLVELGIDPDRILLEDQSTSTAENLEYSAEIIQEKEEANEPQSIHATVVLTTTDFHMFRAMYLARNHGYESISGNPAPSEWWLIPTNYTREFLAVVKDVVIKGHLK